MEGLSKMNLESEQFRIGTPDAPPTQLRELRDLLQFFLTLSYDYGMTKKIHIMQDRAETLLRSTK